MVPSNQVFHQGSNRYAARPLPDHWIGVEKGWEDLGDDPRDFLVSLPPSQMGTHVYVAGGTGAGKTTLLTHLMAQDVLLGHSFVVIDLRGTLASAVTEICAGRVDPRLAKVIDLREAERPTGFCPLYGGGEPYFRALNVLGAMQAEWGELGPQLAETMRNALLLLAESGRRLTDLHSVFHDRSFLMRCLDACADPQVVGYWHRFAELSRQAQATLASPVTNKLTLLLSTESLRKTLGHPNPVDLAAHLDTPGSVTIVSLAADQLHGAGRMMGRILFSEIRRAMFDRPSASGGRANPVRLYVDEFQNFADEEFGTVLTEARKYGLSLVIAHQTLSQIEPKLRSLILNNVGTKFAFHTGREDGSVLSKDLTGDPKAVDFSRLAIGEALMWSRGMEPLVVEINEPIVSGTAPQSAAAREFVRAAREADGPPCSQKPFLGESFTVEPLHQLPRASFPEPSEPVRPSGVDEKPPIRVPVTHLVQPEEPPTPRARAAASKPTAFPPKKAKPASPRPTTQQPVATESNTVPRTQETGKPRVQTAAMSDFPTVVPKPATKHAKVAKAISSPATDAAAQRVSALEDWLCG